MLLIAASKKGAAMAQMQITMEQIKEILQLHKDGVPIREIARRVGVSRNSVRKYLQRIGPSTAGIDDSKALADAAYGAESQQQTQVRPHELAVHFAYAQRELTRTGVTRQLLWQQYIEQHPNGYSYSQYCYHLQQYLQHADTVMHLSYTPGDMIMLDFAGKKLQYVDKSSGELIDCEVFVSILPFSGLIYCTAVHTQRSHDFMTCINRMLLYYGGAPVTLLCDNLKTAVIRPDRYEPTFTDLCYQLSEHYHTTFSATRPYSPRDKGLVEGAVKIVYTSIFAPLRDETFTSLEALNKAIGKELEALNHKPYKGTQYSRRHYFEQHEQALLKELPTEPFSRKKVVQHKVQRNYHVQLSEMRHYFSVPYTYVGQYVRVMYDDKVVEIYHNFQRIAVHKRGLLHHTVYHTLLEHMPPKHAHMLQVKGWTTDDLLARALAIGPEVQQTAALLFTNNFFVEQNYKSCQGLLMLEKTYGKERLIAACTRALRGSRVSYGMVKNILQRGLDKQSTQGELFTTPEHDNIRGAAHYQ